MTQKVEMSEVQTLLELLIAAHGSPQAVAGLLGGRASERSVYRWRQGETVPQSSETLSFIRKLVADLRGEGNEVRAPSSVDHQEGG